MVNGILNFMGCLLPKPSTGDIRFPIILDQKLAWLRLKNTPTASLKRDKILPTSVLDMTVNNLMVKFL